MFIAAQVKTNKLRNFKVLSKPLRTIDYFQTLAIIFTEIENSLITILLIAGKIATILFIVLHIF